MGPVADPHYAGSDKYRRELEQSVQTGECIFCAADFQQGEKVLARSEGWFVRKNDYPKKDEGGVEPDQFLIMPFRHVADIFDVTGGDWEEIRYLLAWLGNTFGHVGGGIGWRFGASRQSGATIIHLHLQVVFPRIPNPADLECRAVPLWFPFG